MGSIFDVSNKHFSVSSYFSLPLSEKYILIDCTDELCLCLFVKGEGVLQKLENGRFKTVEKIKKNELVVATDFVGRLSFSSNLSYIQVINVAINENHEEVLENTNNLTLGFGDILKPKPLAKHIDASSVTPLINEFSNDLTAQNFLVFSSNEYISNALNRLVDLLNSNRIKFHDHFFTEVLINEILLDLGEKHHELMGGNQHISRILAFIDTNYKDPLTLVDIAKGVNLNVSYMQKVFKEITGNTVYDYLVQYRINQAITLMKSTTLPLVDIAIEAGFSNRQTFYNCFKSFMGYTPKTFRKFLSVTNTMSSSD